MPFAAPSARPRQRHSHECSESRRNDLSDPPLPQNSSTMQSLSAPSFHTPPQSRTRFGWWRGHMICEGESGRESVTREKMMMGAKVKISWAVTHNELAFELSELLC